FREESTTEDSKPNGGARRGSAVADALSLPMPKGRGISRTTDEQGQILAHLVNSSTPSNILSAFTSPLNTLLSGVNTYQLHRIGGDVGVIGAEVGRVGAEVSH
ncbi:MAG: hypothetical protein WBM66_11995, partial [Thiothrix litoralis]